MTRLMERIGDGLNAFPEYQRGCARLGVTIPPILWVDDLAVPLATVEPSQMVPLIKAMELLHSTFRDHGMTMNFESGTSEAVVMYRGKGMEGCQLMSACFV